MPRVPMPQFLRSWGLLLLPVSSEEIVPGVVVTGSEKGFRRVAHLRYLLEGAEDAWPTEVNEGHIADTVEWERSLKGRASLDLPGVLSVGGGLTRAEKGVFQISQVKTRRLKGAQLDEIPLQQRLNEWRKDPPHTATWRQAKGQLVVQSTWFAAEYTVDFQSTGGADIKAEVAGNVTVAAGAQYDWVSNTKLRVTGNDRVPFAIRVWKIKG